MLALVRDATTVRLTEREPAPRPDGEARIRLRLAGVCSTDLELSRGYMDFRGVLGHEFVGDVVEATNPAWIGARVVGDINAACRACDFCMRDEPHHCERRTVLGISGRDGVFQETFLLPERNLVRVPAHVPDEQAVFAEPLAAACRILEQVDLQPWDRVAVLGDGKLGCLCAWVVAEKAHSVTLYGRHPGRVPHPVSIVERPAPPPALEPSDRFDVVVEATGAPDGLEVALRLTRPGGTLVLKTTCAGRHEVSLAPVVIDELKVVGSRCGPLPTAVEKLEEARIPVQTLIDRRFPLAEAEAALARAAEPGALKVLIEGAPR